MIEIAPLAFMRGRTLHNSFVILDEAQNTTVRQMKMFLTRLGVNSKAVVTGDVTQIDLPHSRTSGLVNPAQVLEEIDDISIVQFDRHDVVRHKPSSQRIVNAYKETAVSTRWARRGRALQSIQPTSREGARLVNVVEVVNGRARRSTRNSSPASWPRCSTKRACTAPRSP